MKDFFKRFNKDRRLGGRRSCGAASLLGRSTLPDFRALVSNIASDAPNGAMETSPGQARAAGAALGQRPAAGGALKGAREVCKRSLALSGQTSIMSRQPRAALAARACPGLISFGPYRGEFIDDTHVRTSLPMRFSVTKFCAKQIRTLGRSLVLPFLSYLST